MLVAYSGGYLAAAWSVHYLGIDERVRGEVLLDALYGETGKFARWIEERRSGFFFSAYSGSSRDENVSLQWRLSDRHIEFLTQLPPQLSDGDVAFLATGAEVTHRDFVSHAWVAYPLKAVLRRISGFARGRSPSGRPVN